MPTFYAAIDLHGAQAPYGGRGGSERYSVSDGNAFHELRRKKERNEERRKRYEDLKKTALELKKKATKDATNKAKAAAKAKGSEFVAPDKVTYDVNTEVGRPEIVRPRATSWP